MPQQIIGLSQNLGFPGTVSRNGDELIEGNRAVHSTDAVGPNFGDPVILNNDVAIGSYSSVAAYIGAGNAFTAAKFAGCAVREVKTPTSFLAQNTIGDYLPGQYLPVLERGSMSVTCNVGTPVANGPVYVRVTVNAAIPAGVVGGFEAVADTTNAAYTVLLTNAVWHQGADRREQHRRAHDSFTDHRLTRG